MKANAVPYGSVQGYKNAYRVAREGGAAVSWAICSIVAARYIFHLGPRFHSLFQLWRRPLGEWNAYITNNEANERHRLLSSSADQFLTDNKLDFWLFCKDANLATIPILGVMGLPGQGRPSGFADLTNRTSFVDFLVSAPERLFVKPIFGQSGEGAFSLTREDAGWRFGGIVGTVDDVYDFCVVNVHRGLLFQPAIRPHPGLERSLSPKALCTVRAVTSFSPGGARLIFSLLRLPVGDNQTDNWSVSGATGNLVAPIDPETGVLGPGVGSRRNDWPFLFLTDIHPDTRNAISGYTLPLWSEVRALVLEGQEALAAVPTLLTRQSNS